MRRDVLLLVVRSLRCARGAFLGRAALGCPSPKSSGLCARRGPPRNMGKLIDMAPSIATKASNTVEQREERRTMREPRDENAAAMAKADYLRANLSPAAGPMETPCLVWRGSSIRGHGSIGHKNHNYRVHRLAYLIANGPIPPGLQVMHSCDNGLCSNPLTSSRRDQSSAAQR